MGMLLEQILNGVNYGLLLFLMAAGLSLVFGVMHLINLAHGSLFMLGAFCAAFASAAFDGFLLPAFLAIVTCFFLGLVVERLIIRRLYTRSHLDQVLATFGLILFFNELMRWLSGGSPLFVPVPSALSDTVLLGGLSYPAYRLAVTLIAALVALGMWYVLTRTRVGILVRASANNPAMVRHIGKNVNLVAMSVFAVGAALAGLAGVLTAPLVSVEVGMGEQVLIVAFVIVVIGGLGSIRGTLFAALAVGLIDTLGRAYTPMLLSGIVGPRTVASLAPAVAATFIYLLMAIVLMWRPNGLFEK